MLDVLIYTAGIRKSNAFSGRDNFEHIAGEDEGTREIVAINPTSAITVATSLVTQLRRSANPKIVLIGSINGLVNDGMSEIAHTASKFGLRVVAHGLLEPQRVDLIGDTVINPGSFATTGARIGRA